MASVLIVVKSTKQPRGGFISPSSLVKTPLSDGQVLTAAENIPAATVGMVVDYMTRFMDGTKLENAYGPVTKDGFTERSRESPLRELWDERPISWRSQACKGLVV